MTEKTNLAATPAAEAVDASPAVPAAKRVDFEITQVGRTRVDPYHWMKDDGWQEVMRDPVATVDGQTYERSAIEQWLGEHNTSPLTGLPLASTELAPNAQLLTQIASFLAAHPHLRPT